MRTFGVIAAALFVFSSCSGDEGPVGPAGPDGPAGTAGDKGDPGDPGMNGTNGTNGISPWIVGGGLTFTITGTSIDTAGVAKATFRVTDSAGTPLDAEANFTAGAVNASFVFAYLDGTYTAYTTRDQTSPITSNTETQASSDSGGTLAAVDVADGVFEYTFGTAITSPAMDKTNTVAVYATRDFEGERYVANATFDFRPDGNAVTETRDIVTDAACAGCHTQLSMHGNRRRDVKLCITCHSPQSVDPDTGNTVDMGPMIHKIHMGADLPSVAAGGEYKIIGFNQNVHDYSTVVFPMDNNNCATCHQGSQGNVWQTTVTRASCTTCHDDITFVSPATGAMVLHTGGAQADDTACSGCHPATGGAAGIVDSHYTFYADPATKPITLAIDAVTDTGPGQTPTVDFTVTYDGAPRDIMTSALSTLRVTIAGPTTDFAEYWQATIQGGGASGSLSAINAAMGQFRYVLPAAAAIPAGATGSYAVSLEGYIQNSGEPRNAANHPVAYVAVTDTTAVPRREVVDNAACASCHDRLGAHGGQRTDVKQCIMCHTANNPNDARISRVEGTTVIAEPTDFKVMIHKIHRGEKLVNPYILGGFTPPTGSPTVANPVGNPHDMTHVRFPGNQVSCGTCHKANTYDLPLKPEVLPSLAVELVCTEPLGDDADDYCNTRTSTDIFIPPTTAVCTSCHDADYTQAHAETMTSMSGAESCATCHGPGSTYDIAHFHKLSP